MVGLHRGHFVGIIAAYLVHLGHPFARLRIQMDAREIIEMTSQNVAFTTSSEVVLREVERQHHRHRLSCGERAFVAQ